MLTKVTTQDEKTKKRQLVSFSYSEKQIFENLNLSVPFYDFVKTAFYEKVDGVRKK